MSAILSRLRARFLAPSGPTGSGVFAVQVHIDGRWHTQLPRYTARQLAAAASFEHRCTGQAARVREFL